MDTRRILASSALVLASAGLLAGCSLLPAGETPTGSPTPSASASASAPPESGGDGSAIFYECDEVVSPQALYDYNPNYAVDTTYTPAAGSPGERAVEQGGIACGWINLTSNLLLEVAVSQPGDAAIAEDLAVAGEATTAYGDGGYFTTVGQTGVATIVRGETVVIVSSPEAIVAEDLTVLVEGALATVGI